jgi:hypothetical protein
VSLLVSSLRLPGWIKEELGAWSYCNGNNRGQAIPLRRTTNCMGWRNRTPARSTSLLAYIAIRLAGRNPAWKAREVLRTGRARFPLLFGSHFLAVTRSAILSYSVLGIIRRVTTSPGSL